MQGILIMPARARPLSTVQRLLPVLGWLPTYRRDWLLPDVLAGLGIWAVMVPEGMAYAGFAACRRSWRSTSSSRH